MPWPASTILSAGQGNCRQPPCPRTLTLFQLSANIERMLADLRRIIAVRTHMNLDQAVRFLNRRDGQACNGKDVAKKGAQVTLHEGRHVA